MKVDITKEELQALTKIRNYLADEIHDYVEANGVDVDNHVGQHVITLDFLVTKCNKS